MKTSFNTITASLVLLLIAVLGCTDGSILDADAPASTVHENHILPGNNASTAAAKADAHSPVYINFDKSAVAEGVWEGAVDGDVAGALRTELTALRVSGSVWHVEFNWIVDAGDRSFTAHLKGILNTGTGSVTMNGKVVEGWLTGAQVHEEGQLIDAALSRFEGTIRIMPATAK